MLDSDKLVEFAFDENYQAINGGYHKRHPLLVGTPSVIRHIGLWCPETSTDNEIERRRWLFHIDIFLAQIFCAQLQKWRDERGLVAAENQEAFSATRPTINYSSGNRSRLIASRLHINDDAAQQVEPRLEYFFDEDDRKYETITIKYYQEGIPIKIRATAYQEYVTITWVAQLCYRKYALTDDGFRRRVEHHVTQLEGVVYGRWGDIVKKIIEKYPTTYEQQIDDDIKRMYPHSHFLYFGIWDKEIDPSIYCGGDRPQLKITDLPFDLRENVAPFPSGQLLGSKFSDQRCCVFSFAAEPGYESESSVDDTSIGPLDAGRENNVYDQAGQRSNLAAYVNNRVFNSRDSICLVDTFLPFLKSAALDRDVEPDAVEPSAHFLRTEYSATRILDGRGIHISSLESDIGTENRHPSCFILVFRNRHRWQIGRAAERINNLGTLRRASLKRIAELKAFSRRLMSFKLKSDTTLQDPDSFDFQAIKSDEIRVYVSDEEANQFDSINTEIENRRSAGATPSDIRTLEAEADTIRQHRELKEGLIAYWIERTRYYIESYVALLPDLRARSIEGFQPYAEFVKRRQGGTWGFIETLARRYTRVQRRMESIYITYNMSMNKKANEINQQNNERGNLLRSLAELAAPFAVSYYGGYIIKEGFEFAEHLIYPDSWVAIPESLMFVVGACISYAAYRWMKHGFEAKFRKQQISDKV